MANLGTEENPFTHQLVDGYERREKWCKCGNCGYLAVCLPNNDFYEGLLPNKQLYCGGCMWTLMSRMSKEKEEEKFYQLIQKLKELGNSHDGEVAHSAADSILLEIIKLALPEEYKEIEDAYGEVPKWYA
jgi:hypothetical protein